MLMPAPFRNMVCSRAGSVDSPSTGESQPCLRTVRTAWRSCERKSSCRSSPFLTRTKTRRCGLRTIPGRPQARAGFRSEFDPAKFTSMAHGPTVAVVSESTSGQATVGNRVRPGPKNSLSSRRSWGTQPRRQETLDQRSHPTFRQGTLNGAVVNSSLFSEKHCRVIRSVLQLTPLFAGTYDGMSFGRTLAFINVAVAAAMDECNQGELNDVS